ncbi:MAG: RagB/SusD family nutrient uptake outer membrane protein [Bacteroides sp.]|nr:RagB/SusD family nutrient uptake outer membrane protein [Bacteroides sp.]
MKKINKIKNMFIAAASVLALTGCSDFLEKDSLSAVSSATFWQTPEDALSGLAACYDALQSHWLYDGGPWECGILNMDCMTDNGGHFNWSGWMAGYDIANGIHDSNSWLAGDYWKACYEAIKRCNTLIDNIERVDMDADLVAQYKAEAIVIRSLIYTLLTSTFQDVPYLVHVSSLADAEVAKTPKAEIVEGVMADLKKAAEVLPSTAPARGRITKGAALSLLGRLALYNEKWTEAISAYEQVLGLGYSLFPDYSTLFTQENEGCNEIIWGLRFEGPGLSEGSNFCAHWNTPIESMNGTVDLADAFYRLDGTSGADEPVYGVDPDGNPSTSFDFPNMNRYDNRDPRLYATLFVPGMTWGNNSGTYGGASPSYSTVYVMKYFDPYDTANSWDSGQDFYIIRYAEVLLSLAEAYVEGGRHSDAEPLVNQVRTRAGMPTIAEVEGSNLSKDAMREVVRHERRVELAFEGLRLFDLYRWHILKDAVDRVNNEASKYGFWYEYRNYRGEQEYVWPIPQSELDCNSKLVQHSLWQ